MKISIIDYGCGNTTSLKNAIEYLGFEAVVTNDPQDIKKSDKLILPGVGTFRQGMQNLQKGTLKDHICERVFEDKKLILGICLGAQLMLKSSEENLEYEGLSWIDGQVIKINSTDKNCRVPHVGWDTTYYLQDSVFSKKDDVAIYYYTHSFCMDIPLHQEHILARCEYASGFISAFMKDNIVGCQFHPEKSQKAGLNFLNEFLRL
jgi:glutamine amidotransferase